MDFKADEPVRSRMESLRLACDGEIALQRQKMDAFIASSRESLLTTRARAQETAQCQGLVCAPATRLFSLPDALVEARSVTAPKVFAQLGFLFLSWRCWNEMQVWGIY